MPRYLFIGTYASEGAKAVLSTGGTARRSVIEKMISDAGGRMETFDFGFGADDVYSISELPDNRTAAALALTINGSGVASVRTVVLMTPEEVDTLGQVPADYRPPTG
jgi:uncharacterized protein with GYD domain